jgi:hypothetical protein
LRHLYSRLLFLRAGDFARKRGAGAAHAVLGLQSNVEANAFNCSRRGLLGFDSGESAGKKNERVTVVELRLVETSPKSPAPAEPRRRTRKTFSCAKVQTLSLQSGLGAEVLRAPGKKRRGALGYSG